MFLKPTEQNFEGLDYIQLWDYANVPLGSNAKSKVVLCVQNKLEHSTPAALRVDGGKMENVILKLERVNSDIYFLPVYFTMTKKTRILNQKKDLMNVLAQVHGGRRYVFLTEEAISAFLYPFATPLLLTRTTITSQRKRKKTNKRKK